MPAGNGTGPNGTGPLTGRGMGFCAGYDSPGYMNSGGGRGRGFRGRGFGMGRGFADRWAYPGSNRGYPVGAPAYSQEDQLSAMKGQADYLEKSLQNVRDQIARMENGEKK